MKILIVDDHPLLRKGAIQLITAHYEDCVLDEASNGAQALEKVRNGEYDIVLLDISLPDINGLEVLAQIKKMKPSQIVLIMSMMPEENYAVRALKLGASGYLTKGTVPEEIVSAFERILKGGKYISNNLSEHLIGLIKPDKQYRSEPHESLSKRELQVMLLIASGKKIKDIADLLFLSVKTVSTHRARILKKMDMSTNSELIRYSVEKNLYQE